MKHFGPNILARSLHYGIDGSDNAHHRRRDHCDRFVFFFVFYVFFLRFAPDAVEAISKLLFYLLAISLIWAGATLVFASLAALPGLAARAVCTSGGRRLSSVCIAAFFISSRATGNYAAMARDYHARFLAAYPSMEGKVPLVRMDVDNWSEPFSAAEQDA